VEQLVEAQLELALNLSEVPKLLGQVLQQALVELGQLFQQV
jgi:hypothetical protein